MHPRCAKVSAGLCPPGPTRPACFCCATILLLLGNFQHSHSDTSEPKTQDFKFRRVSPLNKSPLHIITATSRNPHSRLLCPFRGLAPTPPPIHEPPTTTSNMTHDSAPVADTSHSHTDTSHTSHDTWTSTSQVYSPSSTFDAYLT